MISLNDYIKRRNGVPLGHSNSLINMLERSLGAKSFDLFWVYWNPIWSFLLHKYINKPLKSVMNPNFALILTFCFSGFIHDLVGFFLNKNLSFLFTYWFVIMGIIVVVFKKYRIAYKRQNDQLNYACNTLLIVVSFLLTKSILNGIF